MPIKINTPDMICEILKLAFSTKISQIKLAIICIPKKAIKVCAAPMLEIEKGKIKIILKPKRPGIKNDQ